MSSVRDCEASTDEQSPQKSPRPPVPLVHSMVARDVPGGPEGAGPPLMFIPHGIFPGNGMLGFPPHMSPNFLCHTFENRARWIENMPYAQRPLPLIVPGYRPYATHCGQRVHHGDQRVRRRRNSLPPIEQALRTLYLLGQSIQREKDECATPPCDSPAYETTTETALVEDASDW